MCNTQTEGLLVRWLSPLLSSPSGWVIPHQLPLPLSLSDTSGNHQAALFRKQDAHNLHHTSEVKSENDPERQKCGFTSAEAYTPLPVRSWWTVLQLTCLHIAGSGVVMARSEEVVWDGSAVMVPETRCCARAVWRRCRGRAGGNFSKTGCKNYVLKFWSGQGLQLKIVFIIFEFVD